MKTPDFVLKWASFMQFILVLIGLLIDPLATVAIVVGVKTLDKIA